MIPDLILNWTAIQETRSNKCASSIVNRPVRPVRTCRIFHARHSSECMRSCRLSRKERHALQGEFTREVPFRRVLAATCCALLAALHGLGQLVYTNNFESTVGLEWSRTNFDTTPFGARTFLGQFGNDTVTLTLSNLTAHTEVDLALELFIIRSWDGLASLSSAYELWSVGIGGGPILLRTTFCPFEQASNARQSYPAPYARGNFPPNTGAAERYSLGYYFYVQDKTYFWDAVYHLNLRFPHSSNSLVLNFTASALEPLDNESCARERMLFTTGRVMRRGVAIIVRRDARPLCRECAATVRGCAGARRRHANRGRENLTRCKE